MNIDERYRIPLRIDEGLALRIKLAMKKDRKSFSETVINTYLENHRNDKLIMIPTGYNKSAQFVLNVRLEVREQMLSFANKHKISVSAVIRNAFIEWDLAQNTM